MKQLTLTLFLSFTFILNTFSQGTKEFFEKADTFFQTNVKNGLVDYKSLSANPEKLNELLLDAKSLNPSVANAKEYQAFWINTYNLVVIKGIVDKYPVKSPLDIPGFFDKTKYEVGGVKTTLNDIENKLLRAKFPSEARFHFVLVCAGLGCPPIINKAYRPETLNEQLETQTKLAINDPNFIRFSKNKLKVSQIFEWYNGDFTQNGQTLVGFINKYRSEPIPEKTKVSYYPYDWTLNQTK